jgi:hypothetical protein
MALDIVISPSGCTGLKGAVAPVLERFQHNPKVTAQHRSSPLIIFFAPFKEGMESSVTTPRHYFHNAIIAGKNRLNIPEVRKMPIASKQGRFRKKSRATAAVKFHNQGVDEILITR